MDSKVKAVSQNDEKKDKCPKNIEERRISETVSPIPEWNEHIQKVVVGYH